jgi:hypothetical protein
MGKPVQVTQPAFPNDTLGKPLPSEWRHLTTIHACMRPKLEPPPEIISSTLSTGTSEVADFIENLNKHAPELVKGEDAYRLLQIRITTGEGEHQQALVKMLREIRDLIAEVAKKAEKVKWPNLGMSIGLIVSFIAAVVCSIHTGSLNLFLSGLQGKPSFSQTATSLTRSFR